MNREVGAAAGLPGEGVLHKLTAVAEPADGCPVGGSIARAVFVAVFAGLAARGGISWGSTCRNR